ncbi:class II aldolase/adducin family protein [Patescibacteria group bacterium]|nr:class II aldolase/adducin family protein [Patescibacteria group bacterium]
MEQVGKVKFYPKHNLKGKVVYLILTGAKKIDLAPRIIKELIDEEAKVITILTQAALNLIDTKSLEQIRGNFVKIDFDWSANQKTRSIPEEDIVIIAPCTFNTLNKIYRGIADSYPLTIIATAIAKKKPVFIAPAFNEMWFHPLIQETISNLTQWGCRIIWPQITPQKVTMMDYRKVLDTVYFSQAIIRYNSLQFDSPDLKNELNHLTKTFSKSFLEIGRHQYKIGLNSGVSGCYSVKIDKSRFFITSTGADLASLKKNQLTLVLKINKKKEVEWCGQNRPSSETPLHAAIYQAIPKAQAIVHSHCPRITYSPDLQSLATPHYIRHGEIASYKSVIQQMQKQDGFVILRYHGEFAYGQSLKEACAKIEEYLPKTR